MASEVKELKKRVDELYKTYNTFGKTEFVRSGSVVIDALLGGGIPRGTIISWSAENGCGKSTGALHISRQYCYYGHKVVYLDYEHGINESQLKGERLMEYLYSPENPSGTFYLFQPQTYKDAEKILDTTMGDIDLFVIDSITSVLPEKMKEASSEDVQIGVDARIMSQFLRKYKAEVARTGCTWLLINQMRTKIATGYGQQTHDAEAGGNALKFYADIRLMMKKAFKGTLERDEEVVGGVKKIPFGAICTIYAEKNRYERPKIPLNIAIIFGIGISNEYAYYDWLTTDGTIKKSGAWYEIKVPGVDSERFHGMGKVIEWINKNKNIVRDYIQSKGGYRLLLNSSEAIDIGSGNTEEDAYSESTIEQGIEFDEVVGEGVPSSVEVEGD